MWEGLDAVGWAGLEHNYGAAADVPGLLRRCAGAEEREAGRAAAELHNLLFHQGGWVCSAASAALPFVLRLAGDPRVARASRSELLDLVASLAAEAAQVEERFLDPGWGPAWAAALPEVVALLGDPDAGVRRGAACVLGGCGSPGESVLPGLLRCWDAEDDAAIRLELALALGRSVLRAPAGPYGGRAGVLLRGLLDAAEPQVRLAAVHALAPGDPGLPARRLDLVLGAVRDPGVEVWRHVDSVGVGPLGVHHWTSQLLPGPDPSFVLGLLADHPDEEQRSSALAQAGALLATWRSPTAALLPHLAARLDDPAPEVRLRAAELLACLGHAAAAYADEAAALLPDTATTTRYPRGTVGEAALWALARMNDPRCLPGLTRLIAGAPSSFAAHSQHFGAVGPHHVVLPSLPEVLAQLSDHAEALLPAIAAQLTPAADGALLKQLCTVLAEWGPLAAPAVPALLNLLADEQTWPLAAKALGAIGPAAAPARDLLRARAHTPGPHAELAAWAYWRTGGAPGPALDAFARALEERRHPHPALRRLADLGPHAAPLADRLKVLTSDIDSWTRVEAAHTLWTATCDATTAVPVLTDAVQPLTQARYLPVMLPALTYLRPFPSAAHLLRAVPALDRRLRNDGGWRGFVQDESARAAVANLLKS